MEDGKLGVRVQLLKFCSAHKDEGNPQKTFFLYLIYSKETVCVPRTLCTISMDMQFGIKNIEIEVICPEDNCL